MRNSQKGDDFTQRYRQGGYAIYIPSLQSPYAASAIKQDRHIRGGQISHFGNGVGFKNRDLNFFDPKSSLWTCAYTLYSSGQFANAVIQTLDMITERDRTKSVVIGDSGGFQLGSGKITNKAEAEKLKALATDPRGLIAKWDQVGFRDRTLNWLESYCDYSMTLDAVLWGSNEAITHDNAAEQARLRKGNKSVFRHLSVQELIDLTVQNNRYFMNHRRGRTKFLNVLQDIGNGSGEAWYQAVKDAKFEGWSFGGATKVLPNLLGWLHRLRREGRLDGSEWLHILQASPPKFSPIYSAIQKALRKSLSTEITISYDSSSPHQAAGKLRAMYRPPELTDELGSWRLGNVKIEQSLHLARGLVREPLPVQSPLSRFFELNDLNWHQELYRDTRVDAFSEHLITSHNIYVFHKAALDACDLVFGPRGEAGLVPSEIDDFVALMDDFFERDDCDQMLAYNRALLMAISPPKKSQANEPTDDE